MGNEGGRTGSTPASATERSLLFRKLQFPECSQAHAPFSGPLIGTEHERVGGRGGSSSPLIGGAWSFCPPFTAATSRGRLKHWFFIFYFFLELERSTRRRSRGEPCSCPRLAVVLSELGWVALVPARPPPAARARERRRVPEAGRVLCAALGLRRWAAGRNAGAAEALLKLSKQWTVRGAWTEGGERGSELRGESWLLPRVSDGARAAAGKFGGSAASLGLWSNFLLTGALTVLPLPFPRAEQTGSGRLVPPDFLVPSCGEGLVGNRVSLGTSL